jgi:hypothetical protein
MLKIDAKIYQRKLGMDTNESLCLKTLIHVQKQQVQQVVNGCF